MRWSFRDTWALPVPVFEAAVRFVNEHVVGKGDDLDDLD
jgi:hypothetical protein